MDYTSKKSEQFKVWIRSSFEVDELTDYIKLLVNLESTARMVIHDFDTVGEVTEQDMRALARAVKELRVAYASS